MTPKEKQKIEGSKVKRREIRKEEKKESRQEAKLAMNQDAHVL